ncbi:twin-arginine translocase subunit TatC [Ectobacillus polymachus]|uniref:twin-arginine translocase subunit TatC n=1 Tax=Ectobacillus polymachus TaxID=1508806 RepID=UPI003A83999F
MNLEEFHYVEHIEELRKRLIITITSFVIFLILGFAGVKPLYQFITRNLTTKLVVLGPGDILSLYITLAAVIAILCTIPVAAFQCWLFVKPALREYERRATLMYIPLLFILFAIGLVIGYFFVLPNILSFITFLGGDVFREMYTVEKYFGFIMHLVIPFALSFDMPVVFMFLTSIGLVKPMYLRKARRYAYFILVIVACCISPPELVSHLSVSVPLILLYESSVLASFLAYRSKQKREQAYMTTIEG